MRNPAHNIRHLHSCISVCTDDCRSVLELGCGIADKLAICRGPILHGVDIYYPYLKFAYTHWGRSMLLEATEMCEFAREAVTRRAVWDAVMMIDSLEHLTKPQGLRLLRNCRKIARRRLIIFVPEGEHSQQDSDLYDLGGTKWQRHRSSWSLQELQSRGFDVCRWKNLHGPGKHALFATWRHI